MKRVTRVEVLEGYRLRLVFNDGVQGAVDLSALVGKGVFSSWRDRAAFERVRIGSSGELAWGDEVDLCPDALYLQMTGQEPEDVLPGLRREPADA